MIGWSKLNAGIMLVRLCAADKDVSNKIRTKLDPNLLSPPQKFAIEMIWIMHDNGYIELPKKKLLSLAKNEERSLLMAVSRISREQRLKDMILKFENDVDEFIECLH